jgi:hypothetical protein
MVLENYIQNQLQDNCAISLQDHCNHEIIQPKDHTLFPFLYGKYALMITEPDPENDIHIVFDSFIKLNQYPIVAVGNWQSNPYGQALYEKYKQGYIIKLLNPQIQLRTLNMLRTNCFIYLDAHHQKNETASLIEAMFMQLPIIAYKSEYNKLITANNAFYYRQASDLIELLHSLHPTKAAINGALMKSTLNSQLAKPHLIH